MKQTEERLRTRHRAPRRLDMGRLLVLLLLRASVWGASSATRALGPEEVELLRLNQQSIWTSPNHEFRKSTLPFGDRGRVPVLQACASEHRRSVVSQWTARGEANLLLLDITFALMEERSGQPVPLQVHRLDLKREQVPDLSKGLNLTVSQHFPSSHVVLAQMGPYLSNYTAVPLGRLTSGGFQLGLSYTGTCALVTSIRVYYRRCPETVHAFSSFRAKAAGFGTVRGSCVPGAEEMSPPFRECSVEGVWGPLKGLCVCAPGHQPISDSCQACGVGFYRAANQSRGCQRCPPHSETHREGADKCDCVSGYSRLPSDLPDLGCTRPPSSPVNLITHHHGDSLILSWDAPLDWGGRSEMSYRVLCERRGQDDPWESCGDPILVLPRSENLTTTSVNLTGTSPHEDYRLSVQARNDVSDLQGAPHSMSTVTIYRGRVLPAVTEAGVTVGPTDLNHMTMTSPKRGLILWTTLGFLFVVLFLLAVVPIAVCLMYRKKSNLSSEQGLPLSPINPGVSYTRRPQTEVIPLPVNTEQQAGGGTVLSLLQGFGERLADSLGQVLVERHQLTLGKELGKGEFGSVYEAVFVRDLETMKVAVKTMKVGFHSQDNLHQFLSEAEIMKNFDHDNVVRLLGVTLQPGQDSAGPLPMVILPFMKHGDLRRFLIATRYGDIPMFVPYQTLLRFMVDVAEGMDYLSGQGFLHRDLAARNCMLGDDLRVCVADFGLSKNVHDSQYYRQKDAIRMPVKWMSIESLSESVYTTKSDVWSFGVTMWEILSRGRMPYPGVHNYELLDLLLVGHRLKAPEDCDPKLWEVMHSCWEGQPTKRPSFRELANKLKALLSELPPLEACEEATYINQGLEVAAASEFLIPPDDSPGSPRENIYLSAPVGATAAPP